MRAENEESTLPRALLFLWHNTSAHARFATRQIPHKKGPLARASFIKVVGFSAVAVVPVMPVAGPHRRQFDIGNSGRAVQPGLALHADGLECIGILRTADQKVATESGPDRRVGADAAVISREFAAFKPEGRCAHRPRKPGLIGKAEIHAVAVHGCDVGLRTAAFALEDAFETGHRADHEADILTAFASQETSMYLRQRVGRR